MRKQIVKRFHSLKGKINSVFAEAMGNVQTAESSRTGQADTGSREARGTVQDASAKMIERRDFEKMVNEELKADQKTGCLLIGDVDRFREVYDIYGQDAGNDVLQHVSDVLLDTFPEAACMVRQGRDTYAMWLPDVSPVHADRLYRQAVGINDLLLHPVQGIPPVTLSIGMVFGDSAEDCRSLGRKAVRALNHVKESGRCGCKIYDGRDG